MNELNSTSFKELLSSCSLTSNTHTVNVQTDVLPEVSVAVHLTFVQDGTVGKQNPEVMIWAGLASLTQTNVTPGQLSIAVTIKLTGTQISPGFAVTAIILFGQLITGGSVSFTVMMKLQLAVLPEASATEQFTVVTPFGNIEPEGGAQFGAPTFGQLSLTVGVG